MLKRDPIHWAWIILATCFVNLFINYSVRLGYSVVLPEMIRDLGFNRTAAGSIFNAYLFSYIILTPLAGFLTDRLGARRVITTCTFILGAGVILMGTVKSLWTACIFYAMVGVGATGMWTPIITVVQRWFTTNRRGLALGILSTGYGLGFATMGVVFPWVVDHFSWRYSWYFLGAGALVMVALNAVFLRSSPESAGYAPWGQKAPPTLNRTDEKCLSKAVSLSILFREKTFWIIGLSYLFISYSLYGITTFMVDYAKYQLGLSLEKASLLATVHGICQVLGVLTILPLSDYIGRKRTIILSNSFITACLVGILLSGKSWIMLYFLIGIMAVFYGVTFPIYGACAGDYFPKEVMGTVIGAWTPFYGAGAISVHWVSGILRDTTGSYHQAFLINAVMAALALLLIFTIKKRAETEY
ncbi:MAG: MFS transporter [Deltaproteobacteria bacterium]|nr:MFS transporter [Deltaproteobacteria bacterium]MBW1929938.1 MFS transporter [Deltaproteobacteria bacterium]MBW2025942.1 MFS transporter [Deltaproteobacteria bacterium]MBW2126323.1 MFS transporter [Deltaproteobacteria bacterium]